MSGEVQLPAPGMATNERDPGFRELQMHLLPREEGWDGDKDQQRQGGGVHRDHRVQLGFGSRQDQWEDQIPAS